MNRTTDKLSQWLGVARKPRTPELGERELAVLEILWASSRSTAQVVQGRLNVEVSLSTVQSTLERLHRKRLVGREKAGRAYLYWPLLSRSQLIGDLLKDLARDVAGGDLEPMLSGFVDYVAEESPELVGRITRAFDLPESGESAPEGSRARDDE